MSTLSRDRGPFQFGSDSKAPLAKKNCVRCVQTVRASDAAHGAKLSNYLASVLALRDARAAGAHEALVVNRDGLVVEATTSNLFAVQAGRLVTGS